MTIVISWDVARPNEFTHSSTIIVFSFHVGESGECDVNGRDAQHGHYARSLTTLCASQPHKRVASPAPLEARRMQILTANAT